MANRAKRKTWVHYKMSDDKALRVLPGLRAGLTLKRLGEVPRRFQAYCDAHSEYAREARPLEAANAAAARRRRGTRSRVKTHCVSGHLLSEHARIALHKGCMTRQCRACDRMRYSRGGVMKSGVLEKVTARIAAGTPIHSFTKAGQDGYLLRYDTFNRYRRENPEFDCFVIAATKDNNSKGQLRRRTRIRNNAVREESNDYYKIRAMLPAGFPDKDDVVSDIFESLLNGGLQRDDVRARVQTFIAAHNRMFPTKYAKFGDRPLVSLDEVMFEDGSTTRGDMVSRGLWD